MVFSLPIQMDREGKVLARFEKSDLLLQQQRIGAQIDVLLACYQSLDDLDDLRVHKGFAARNGNHRRTALIHGTEALLRSQFLLKDMGRILDFAAARTCQVAAK